VPRVLLRSWAREGGAANPLPPREPRGSFILSSTPKQSCLGTSIPGSANGISLRSRGVEFNKFDGRASACIAGERYPFVTGLPNELLANSCLAAEEAGIVVGVGQERPTGDRAAPGVVDGRCEGRLGTVLRARTARSSVAVFAYAPGVVSAPNITAERSANK
jgi:hypothetical protein